MQPLDGVPTGLTDIEFKEALNSISHMRVWICIAGTRCMLDISLNPDTRLKSTCLHAVESEIEIKGPLSSILCTQALGLCAPHNTH